MTGFDANRILRVPGRLALDCTDLELAWPHGGVGLGPVVDIIAEPLGQPYPLTDEVRGNAPLGFLEPGGAWKVTAFARGWDLEVVKAAWANGAAGTVSGHGTVIVGGSKPAGTDRTGDARLLAFTPEGGEGALDASVSEPRAPFWFFRSVFCAAQESAQLRYGWDEDFGIPLVFYSLHDSSGNTLHKGARGDIAI